MFCYKESSTYLLGDQPIKIVPDVFIPKTCIQLDSQFLHIRYQKIFSGIYDIELTKPVRNTLNIHDAHWNRQDSIFLQEI